MGDLSDHNPSQQSSGSKRASLKPKGKSRELDQLLNLVKEQSLALHYVLSLLRDVMTEVSNISARSKNSLARTINNNQEISHLLARKTWALNEDNTAPDHAPHLFPKTIGDFKALQHKPSAVQYLMMRYSLTAMYKGSDGRDYCFDYTRLDLIKKYMQNCMESLANEFGLDLEKIGDLKDHCAEISMHIPSDNNFIQVEKIPESPQEWDSNDYREFMRPEAVNDWHDKLFIPLNRGYYHGDPLDWSELYEENSQLP